MELRFLDDGEVVRVEELDFSEMGYPRSLSELQQIVARANEHGESMIRRFDEP